MVPITVSISKPIVSPTTLFQTRPSYMTLLQQLIPFHPSCRPGFCFTLFCPFCSIILWAFISCCCSIHKVFKVIKVLYLTVHTVNSLVLVRHLHFRLVNGHLVKRLFAAPGKSIQLLYFIYVVGASGARWGLCKEASRFNTVIPRQDSRHSSPPVKSTQLKSSHFTPSSTPDSLITPYQLPCLYGACPTSTFSTKSIYIHLAVVYKSFNIANTVRSL